MADGTTTIYGFVLPEVGSSADSWGGKLNQNFQFLDYLLGSHATSGVADAYTLTTGFSLVGYVAGATLKIRPNATNTGAVTLNLDGLGTKAITKNGSTALVAGDLVSGNTYIISYDGTRWQLVGNTATGVFQPLDATLTALAALSWSSGSPVVQFTAADTVSLTLAPSVTTLTVGAGSAATPAMGWTNTGFYESSSDVIGIAINGAAKGTISSSALTFPGNIIWGNASQGTLTYAGSDAYLDAVGSIYLRPASGNGLTISTTLATFSKPVVGRIARSSETTTPTSASANNKMVLTGNATINSGTADDFYLLDPGTSARTITRGSGMTMYVNGADAATATLAANQMGAVHYRTATVVVLTGAFS